MSAIIRLDIEGTAEEIMAAFKTFVGELGEPKVVAQPAVLGTVPREETDYVLELEYPEPRCAWCQTLLTQKQIDSKATYCSTACGSRATVEKRLATIAKKKEKEALRKLIGPELNCLECNKPLTKGQKKFCSKTHSNRYHMRERQLANVKVTHKPITVVAGQGIIKGSALTV